MSVSKGNLMVGKTFLAIFIEGNNASFNSFFSQVQRLAELRTILWNLVNYFVMKEGIDENRDRYQTILNFHNRFLETLSTVVYKAGSAIECDGEGSEQE
jgi:hypothetical protein